MKKILIYILSIIIIFSLYTPVSAVVGMEDGNYTAMATLTGGSGKVVVDSPAKINISDGNITATIILKRSSGTDVTTYSWLKVEGYSTTFNNLAAAGENSKFQMPVSAFDTEINITIYSEVMSTEIKYTIRFDFNSLTSTDQQPESQPEVVETTTQVNTSVPQDSKEEEESSSVQVETEGNSNKDLFIDGGVDTKAKISLEELKSTLGYTMRIKTVFGSVEFDEKAVKELVSSAKGDLIFSMKNLTNENEYIDLGYGLVLEMSLTDSEENKVFTGNSGGNVKVSINYNKDVANEKNLKVYYINESGKEIIESEYNSEEKLISFETTHFSVYAFGEMLQPDKDGYNILPILIVGIVIVVVVSVVVFEMKKRRQK